MKRLSILTLFICLFLDSKSQGYNIRVRVFEVSHEAKNKLQCKGVNEVTGDTVNVEYYHRATYFPKIAAGTILVIRANKKDKEKQWYCRRIKIVKIRG